MVVLSNIILDQGMQDRIDINNLAISDHFILSIANIVATLFSPSIVYLGAQQQAVDLPALFVDYYSISNHQKLAITTNYEFGFTITYVPLNRLSSSELSEAIFKLQQNIKSIHTDVGVFVCYNKNGDITDGLANITGLVSIGEQDSDTEPFINTKELNI